MAIISTTHLCRSMNRYWKRRQYTLLAVTGKDKRVLRLRGKRKITWRCSAMTKLKRTNLFAKLRDAYFRLTLGLSANFRALNGGSFSNKKWIPVVRPFPKVSKAEEGDKFILEVYRSLKASHEFASDGTG